MQTEKELRISHGRKLKAVLLAFCALTPLLTSMEFTDVWLTVNQTCYIEDFYWQPNDQHDRRVTLRMHMLKDADIGLRVRAIHVYRENGKLKNDVSESFRPGLTWLESGRTFEHHRKGEIVDFELVAPYSQMRIGDHEQHISVETRVLVNPERVESWTAYVPYGYISPTEFHPKKGSPFSNEKCFGGWYDGDLVAGYDRHIEVHTKGLEDEYEVDSQGILPLKKMRFQKRLYDYSYAPLTMKSGEIRFYNYLDDFHIGKRKVDENHKPFISVPLELLPDGNESYLRSKKFLYVKEDIRNQTSEYRSETDGYSMTTQIFLPPVKGMGGRFYDCQIRLEGVGDQNADTLIHDFTVFRYSNDVGSKINSRYYVTEVKVDA